MLAKLRARMRGFLKATGGNIAMTMALAAVPLVLATGAGIDYGRGLVVHSNMANALDAAALAVGKQSTKPSACSTAAGSTSQQKSDCANLQAVAQKFFDANFKRDAASTGSAPTVVITIANSGVTLSAADAVPTTFLSAGGKLLGTNSLDTMAVTASSTVVWGQSKLWVALVLDNSGSMSDKDKGVSKMDALKSASATLLTTLQNASQTDGDVEVAVVPFDREVSVGTANKNAAWLYWGFWEQKPVDVVASPAKTIDDGYMVDNDNATGLSVPVDFSAFGPGDPCPFTYVSSSWWSSNTVTISPFGFKCTSSPPNSAGTVDTIPDSGSYKGYICPGADPGTYNEDRHNHYYNGCWTSTKVTGSNKNIQISSGSGATCGNFTNSCNCSGSNSNRKCTVQRWTHTWVANDHSTWTGCITDRDKSSNYDISKTTPVSTNTTGMPADNQVGANCLGSAVIGLGHNWSDLSTKINAMSPNASTNQAIGVANGWLALTPGNPYGAPALPADTSRYIILLSDGLNTQNRWWGNGSSTGTDDTGLIDDRMGQVCSAAKADKVIIYSLFLNVGGTSGDSQPLKDCASDSSKYFDLQSNSDIAVAFAAIGEQITNLRVSK